MSEWRAAINRKALARLDKALPAIFPRVVLIHALARRFTPPLPRLAVSTERRLGTNAKRNPIWPDRRQHGKSHRRDRLHG
jgi:hypothetical protein